MNLALRLFAGVIDLLQFLFFVILLGFQFITPVGGGITGAAAGAYLCYNATSGVISGVLEGLKCAVGGGLIGAGLSTFAGPVGIAIDVCISATFGVLLILLLWVTGRFNFMVIAVGFATEMLPGINGFSPGWSILVHRCIKDYKLKQKGVGTGTRTALSLVGNLGKMIPASGVAAIALKPGLNVANRSISNALKSDTPTRISLQTRNFDGIRPANDNRPQPYVQAA